MTSRFGVRPRRWLCSADLSSLFFFFFSVAKALIKPQYVDHIPKAVKGTVIEVMTKKVERDNIEEMCEVLDLNGVRDRNVADLSGGELQRFAIAVTCIQKGWRKKRKGRKRQSINGTKQGSQNWALAAGINEKYFFQILQSLFAGTLQAMSSCLTNRPRTST
jgi:hypothetical protein